MWGLKEFLQKTCVGSLAATRLRFSRLNDSAKGVLEFTDVEFEGTKIMQNTKATVL